MTTLLVGFTFSDEESNSYSARAGKEAGGSRRLISLSYKSYRA